MELIISGPFVCIDLGSSLVAKLFGLVLREAWYEYALHQSSSIRGGLIARVIALLGPEVDARVFSWVAGGRNTDVFERAELGTTWYGDVPCDDSYCSDQGVVSGFCSGQTRTCSCSGRPPQTGSVVRRTHHCLTYFTA